MKQESAESGASGAPPADPSAMDRLLAIMRRLRGPDGCPWDRQQTLDTLKPFLLEECYEVLDAIDTGVAGKIREELGDVLLQIVFQSAICEERGWFAFEDVAAAIAEKLVRRHPHVFGDTRVSGAGEVLRNWDAIKRAEGGDAASAAASVVDGVPRHLPALLKAGQVQARAARIGFDWKDAAPVWDKLEEELGELREAVAAGKPEAVSDEMGDVLFTLVNLSRFLSVNAEMALQGTTEKFMRRFREVESRFVAEGRRMADCDLPELDAVWDAVKAGEKTEG